VTTLARDLERPHSSRSTVPYASTSPTARAGSSASIRTVTAPCSRSTWTRRYGVAIFETGQRDDGVRRGRARAPHGTRTGTRSESNRADRATPRAPARPEGEATIGTPYQLAALDDPHRRVHRSPGTGDPYARVSSPVCWNTVRSNRRAANKMHRPVAGVASLLRRSARDDAAMTGGGFEDGSAALFDAPMGIAPTPGGDLVVADAGNRRIRVVRRDRPAGTLCSTTGALPPARGTDTAYRILYVGSSDRLVGHDLAGVDLGDDRTRSRPAARAVEGCDRRLSRSPHRRGRCRV